MSQISESINYINNMFMNFEKEIGEECELVHEKRYDLCKSLTVSTGVSLTRGGCPVVKISTTTVKKVCVQLTSYEWDRFWEIYESKIDLYLLQRKRTSPLSNITGQSDKREDINDDDDELFSPYIKIFYDCKKIGTKIIRIESRGKVLMLSSSGYNKLKQLREIITMRLHRLSLMNFPIYYLDLIQAIHSNQSNNESVVDYIKRMPNLYPWMSSIEESEYRECALEIATIIPHQLKCSMGSLKSVV